MPAASTISDARDLRAYLGLDVQVHHRPSRTVVKMHKSSGNIPEQTEEVVLTTRTLLGD
jgi:hypothetical protein